MSVHPDCEAWVLKNRTPGKRRMLTEEWLREGEFLFVCAQCVGLLWTVF
jgi:hypothetical protein